MDWAALMQRTVQISVDRIPAPAPVRVPPPSLPPPQRPVPLVPVYEEAELEEEEEPFSSSGSASSASSAYALPTEQLRRLRTSVYREAEACRTRRGRKVCGISRSKGLCYRAVKYALVGAGMADAHWSEAYAIQAHTNGSLRKRGFRNIASEGYTSANAPLGAILVYSGGPRNYGHIEIRTGESEYCSDYCRSTPVDHYGKKRKLVGVYVKE